MAKILSFLIRFRLRTLIAVVTCVGVAVGLHAREFRTRAREVRVLAEIESLCDGHAIYCRGERRISCITGVSMIVDESPHAPRPIQAAYRFLGDDSSLLRVTSIWIRDASIDDQAVPLLQQFKSLENLSLSRTSISRAGLHQLRKSLPNAEIK